MMFGSRNEADDNYKQFMNMNAKMFSHNATPAVPKPDQQLRLYKDKATNYAY